MPVVAVILVLLAVTLGGCTTTAPREGRCVVCDEQRLVRVVPSAAAGGSVSAGRWDHPLILEEAEWEGILRSLQVRRIRRPLLGPSQEGPPEPVFSDEEARFLAGSLHQAFRQATPRDSVVFALVRPDESGPPLVTSGAWFVERGRLHLRLANSLVAVALPSIRTQVWNDPLFAQDGSYEPVARPGQELVEGPRGVRDVVLAYGTARQQPEPSTVSDGPSSPSVPPPLEQQLGLLKRLHEQGLITDEDYRAKKQQLLDRL